MIQISALEYCFFIFPQFRKDFDILQKIKVLKHIDDEHCKWLLGKISLLEYFYNMGSIAPNSYDTSKGEWCPIETLFGLELGNLDVIGKENKPDKHSEDYKTLITKLNKYRNAKIKIPENATDLNIYRTLIKSTEKRLGRKPAITDYFIIFDFCLRLFESAWNSILHSSKYVSLDDYFGELTFNVYLKKREELTNIIIEFLEKEFPNVDFHAKQLEILNKMLFKMEGIDEIKTMIDKTNKNKPEYIQYLIDNGKLGEDGITAKTSLHKIAICLGARGYDVSTELLLQFCKKDGSKFTFRTAQSAASEGKNIIQSYNRNTIKIQ